MLSRRLFSCAAAILAVATLSTTPAAAQTKWDLSTVWPEANFHTKNAVRFADEVKKATSGAVEITVKAGGQLGFKGPEHWRAVRDGLVPMADVLNIQQIGDEPFLGVEGIAFLCGNAEELKVLLKHTRPVFDELAKKSNQKILYTVPWPTQYLHLKAKAETIEALKGIKIRVPDKGAADLLTAAGMAPVLIPWGETIPALASGAVSGVSTSSVSGVDGKFWEFLKYFHATNHVWSQQMMTVNLDAWNKLKPEHQKAIEELAKKLEPDFWATSIAADTDSNAKLKAQGMELVPIPAPMMAELRSRTKNLLEDFIKRVPISEKPLRAYLAEMKRN